MSLPTNSLIGPYRIDRPIGTGGFATVYRANDDRLDTTVAVKVLAENRSLDADARRRFIEEAQALRRVDSPAVVSVFDVGESADGQPFMVLEYADRGDLAARFAGLGRPATFDEIRDVAAFLRQALEALDRRQMVHRDVKPNNMLIRSDGTVPPAPGVLLGPTEHLLLGDLGFVKDLNLASGLTVGGGTWAYQAPEQKHRMGTIDRRADVYSATAVIAWLLTGWKPTEPQSWPDLVDQIPVDGRLLTVLRRGVADDPAERPPNVDAWFAELSGALSPAPSPGLVAGSSAGPSMNGVGGVATPGHAPAQAAQSLRRRSRRPVALLLALVLGLAGFAVGRNTVGGGEAEGTTSAANGVAATEFEVHGRTVAILGPETVEVGRTATFAASLDVDTSGYWVLPDGSVADAERTVDYRADSAGAFDVALLVIVEDHEPLVVVHRASAEG